MTEAPTCRDYQCAREFFEGVRSAAIEAERTRRQVESMESAEGVRAQGYAPMVRGTRADVNGTSATDARIDYEDRMRKRLEEDWALIDEGCAVVYGPDNRGGVCAILGSSCADALWWRYCAGESWTKAASMVDASVATVKRWCDVAFDTVDAVGWDAAKRGEGAAQD